MRSRYYFLLQVKRVREPSKPDQRTREQRLLLPLQRAPGLLTTQAAALGGRLARLHGLAEEAVQLARLP